MNETESKIYKACKEHFYADGYYNTTVRDICKSVEANSGLFNYYFQNKYKAARRIFDEITINIRHLTLKYYGRDENPAVLMGIMMRLHSYVLTDPSIISFSVDALKEGIFEESVFLTSTTVVRQIAEHYHMDLDTEDLHLLLAITLATEKTSQIQRYNGRIHHDQNRLSDIVLKIFLQGFKLERQEIKAITKDVTEKFHYILEQQPDFVEAVIR